MPKLLKKKNLKDIDYEAFASDLNELWHEVQNDLSEADLNHLKKIELWGRLCSGVGYLTSWLKPNLISSLLISQGNITRWTMMTHHVSHGGYDKVPGVPKRFKSRFFARGKRRWIDWPEWIIPEAWNYEHNMMHHYHTGEIEDPDLVERNVEVMRQIKAPLFLKYAVTFFYMCTWKLTYYAPNTLWIHQKMREHRKNRQSGDNKKLTLIADSKAKLYPGLEIVLPFSRAGIEFWMTCVLPYALLRFLGAPLLFLPLGKKAALNVFLNSLLAEVITNIHAFIIIVPNHAGSDIYRFERGISDKAEFYVRQVTGSVNFNTGYDSLDFLHGWLNYQIEHHLWPDLPMLKYQQIQPQVKAICEKHGVPYVQENVFLRFKKLLQIMVGTQSMLRGETLSREERQTILLDE